MPAIVITTAEDDVRQKREATARRVIAEFGHEFPDLRLLCFFDDQDWDPFGKAFTKANRGFYRPLTAPGFSDPKWPNYVMRQLFVDDPPAWIQKRVFDHVIYLHGSTCSDEVEMSMTFAHELRHFEQWAKTPQAYAAGILVLQLLQYWPAETAVEVHLTSWADIPHERDARIVAKRVVENMFGAERTRDFIDRNIVNPADGPDEEDWRFIRNIASSDSYDLQRETRRLFQRLAPYKRDCEAVLQERSKHIPELKHLDLAKLFNQ